jgi:hypothetical protein
VGGCCGRSQLSSHLTVGGAPEKSSPELFGAGLGVFTCRLPPNGPVAAVPGWFTSKKVRGVLPNRPRGSPEGFAFVLLTLPLAAMLNREGAAEARSGKVHVRRVEVG